MFGHVQKMCLESVGPFRINSGPKSIILMRGSPIRANYSSIYIYIYIYSLRIFPIKTYRWSIYERVLAYAYAIFGLASMGATFKLPGRSTTGFSE